uniref:Uncharacterized protein n=1 Tax=Hyaloperonospora arabidopsidis (strain Emoy2) TaxID=559515 RepID=M4BWI7_HYAAE
MVVERITGKLRWVQLPILNQLSERITGTRAPSSIQPAITAEAKYEHYMVNPVKYSPREITRLRALCGERRGPVDPQELRDGTKDEWKIIQGLAEGDIVGRRLPQFLTSMFDHSELLRLHRTIKAQGEGNLSFRLGGKRTVPTRRRHTLPMTEDILTAEESTNVNRQRIHDLLRKVKTMSYDEVSNSIYVFFFRSSNSKGVSMNGSPVQAHGVPLTQ